MAGWVPLGRLLLPTPCSWPLTVFSFAGACTDTMRNPTMLQGNAVRSRSRTDLLSCPTSAFLTILLRNLHARGKTARSEDGCCQTACSCRPVQAKTLRFSHAEELASCNITFHSR